MSLESAIQENTQALNALIAALQNNGARALVLPEERQADDAGIPATEPEIKKPAAEAVSSPSGATPPSQAKKAAAPAPTPAPESAPESAPGHQTKTESEEAPAITYEQIREGVLKVQIEKGRDTTLALLARHGVKNGKELKPEQYADFMERVNAILTGEYDPVAAELA
jgi:hypothetical protein